MPLLLHRIRKTAFLKTKLNDSPLVRFSFNSYYNDVNIFIKGGQTC